MVNRIYDIAVCLALLIMLVWGAYTGKQLLSEQQLQKQQLEDLAEIQMVKYGLFNVHHWKQEVMHVFETKMDNFSLSPKVYTELEKEIGKYIKQMFREYITSGKLVDQFIEEALASGKINQMFANVIKQNVGPTLASLNLNKQIPGITRNLIAELKQREPEIRKFLVMDFKNMIAAEQSSSIVDPRRAIVDTYGQQDVASTVMYLKKETTNRKPNLNHLAYISFVLIVLALIGCIVAYYLVHKQMAIGLLVVGSIVLLVLGVYMPMINIDARLQPFNISVLDSPISFDEQTIFYQSKSILEVVSTMMQQRGWDMKVVAWMILAFSVLIPLVKLLLTMGTVFIGSLRRSSLVRGIVYHLGKWSMADVFVVAMFMAYIGFYGLVQSQLHMIERNGTGFAVEALNYSHLSYGALFFTAYCIFSIISGIMVKHYHDNEAQ